LQKLPCLFCPPVTAENVNKKEEGQFCSKAIKNLFDVFVVKGHNLLLEFSR